MDETERLTDSWNSNKRYFCHDCRETLFANPDYTCSLCGSGFIEEINPAYESLFHGSNSNNEEQPLRDMFSEMNEGPAAEQGVPPNLSNLLQTLFNQDFRSMISGPRLAGSFDLSNIPFFQVMYGNVNDYAWGPEGLDAVVTQLLNQFETSGPPPMSKHDIDNLPEVAITSEQVNANLQCTVCMEDYVLDEKVKQLKCQHVFHNSCIVPWLEMHGTCPICRKLLSDRATGGDRNDNATASGVQSFAAQNQENPENQSASSSSAPGASSLAPSGPPEASQRPSRHYFDYELEDLD